jgi:glycosyltransferase involved in cell wall biosynthesis
LTIAGAEHPRFPGYLDDVHEKYQSMPGIRWLGQVSNEQIHELFEQAQIVVLPYQASTGSSSVLYQAASLGRPIVASDIDDIFMTAAESGLAVEYFRSGNSTSLAEAIHHLMKDAKTRRNMAVHNFDVIERLGPEEIGRLYLQAFNRALETRHSPARLAIPSMFDLECC